MKWDRARSGGVRYYATFNVLPIEVSCKVPFPAEVGVMRSPTIYITLYLPGEDILIRLEY
jgi:hypothetical protein